MKRIFVLFLAIAMLLGMAMTTQAETVMNETGLPIVNEPVTVTMGVRVAASWGDPNEGGFWAMMEDRTGIHVDFEAIAVAEANEKYNLMMAAGTYPEAFIGDLGGSDSQQMMYGPLGVYVALEDLIDQYCPQLKAAVEAEDPKLLDLCRMLDGHIYTVPTYIDATQVNYSNMMFYNNVWLEQAGMSVPTTTDELYDFLVYIRDNDMNGNGDATDEIPITFDFGSWNGYQPVSLFGAFGYPYTTDYTLVDNGKVVYTAVSDGYKEAIKWLNKLWTEGLINPNAFSMENQNSQQSNPDVPVLGVAMGWSRSGFGSGPWKEQYAYMLPIYGPEGKASSIYDDYYTFYRNRFIVTDHAKNPAMLMRWVDEFYSDVETSYEAIMGHITDNENEPTYALAKDGLIYQDYWQNSYVAELGHTAEENEIRNHTYGRGWYNISFAPAMIGHNMYGDKIVLDPNSQEKAAVAQMYAEQEGNMFTSGDWHTYPPVLLTEEESEEMALLNADLNTYAKESIAAFIVGERDVEAEWDSYVAELEGMGLDRWLEIKQTAYDRFAND